MILLTWFIMAYGFTNIMVYGSIFANLRNKRCPLNSLVAGYLGAQVLLKLKTNLVINR